MILRDKELLRVVEMDAASNQTYWRYKGIKGKSNLSPQIVKYKVPILWIRSPYDDYTDERLNALFKDFRRAPKHSIFILATTEIQ